MTHELLSALVAFAFVTSVTPGPNNLMLMASGANFGFRRSVPHMVGIATGFATMVFLVGMGLTGLFQAVPAAALALKAVSVAYMLWLAWKIAHASAPKEGRVTGVPLTFVQAALFQWVNPKAWAMALTATAVYAPDHSLTAIAVVSLVFGVVNLPSVSCWTVLGQELRRFLSSPRRLRAFNIVMAVLLIGSLVPVLLL